ncbi:MAG: beta-lactamase, partial [Flavipsychrobacter sp.]|nr:beta-lactamase [Flavipsychrobacter sp.]
MKEKIKVHILHCGSARVDASLPFHEKTWNPISFTGMFRSNSHQVWLPVSAYLIEHPKGLVLIDTGWHTDVRVNQRKHLGTFHWIINKAALAEGEAIHEQLKKKGFAPSDIDYLVLSHLHADHVSGLKLVTGAKKILVSDIELKDATNNPMRYISSMWAGVNIETFSFEPSKYGPEKKSFDLFGDDSLIFV